MSAIEIGGRPVGPGHPPFVIAEAGSNHNGDLEVAKALIDSAADAGADAVKFQTFDADQVYVENSGGAEYLDDERSLHDILAEMEMPYEWIPTLHEYASNRNICFMSTPADSRAADELEPYVPAYKVESFMLTHHPFLEYLVDKGKPILLSTGAHTFEEVEDAVDVLKSAGADQFALLQCVSAYPTPLEDINVRVVRRYRDEFDVPAGLSDHTLNPTVAPSAAVALGADVIEKHLTVDRTLEGPDHDFALEPGELQRMVDAIEKTEAVLGDGQKRIVDAEQELHDKTRRFVQANDRIERGTRLSAENIAILAPGENERGLKPEYYGDLLGKTASRNIEPGEGIVWDDVE
ncbi:N-acetylneuraminate synthase family protein [Natrarchaeobius sp. A-rgal3]|uniref:N-acetylneuraminate synthase family protein n=1 Tax=Natrarchaeobius versutus TaxID=1679078 RepID=UPI00351025DF